CASSSSAKKGKPFPLLRSATTQPRPPPFPIHRPSATTSASPPPFPIHRPFANPSPVRCHRRIDGMGGGVDPRCSQSTALRQSIAGPMPPPHRRDGRRWLRFRPVRGPWVRAASLASCYRGPGWGPLRSGGGRGSPFPPRPDRALQRPSSAISVVSTDRAGVTDPAGYPAWPSRRTLATSRRREVRVLELGGKGEPLPPPPLRCREGLRHHSRAA